MDSPVSTDLVEDNVFCAPGNGGIEDLCARCVLAQDHGGLNTMRPSLQEPVPTGAPKLANKTTGGLMINLRNIRILVLRVPSCVQGVGRRILAVVP